MYSFVSAPLPSRRLCWFAHRLCSQRAPRCPSMTVTSPQPQQQTTTPTERRKRVLSGVQPTGDLHLGNYLGAIRQWTHNQQVYDNFFVVVDMHAITVPHDRKSFSDYTLQTVAMYIACGIDPNKSKIFIQSHVKAHAELAWLLNCCTPIGWLHRMIQYKEKAIKQGENVSVGLFDYPILMAADVLLYQPDLVPVGEDQRQHIELTRDIARRYNDIYCKKKRPRTLREPKLLMQTTGARVMSLLDGTNKMSKSAENDNSRINLTDDAAVIKRKVKKCKTDSYEGMEFDNPQRPECNNLLAIYQLVTNQTKEEVLSECREMRWGSFKTLLSDAIAEHLAPIQTRYNELLEDKAYLSSVLKDGYEHANEEAERTLRNVKSDMGFVLPSELGY
eukprot:TRINITY_DN70822_c0_g1_i1.p1 TRINITY_DN70822_c0_g1~~TRINITY_DN70822_c0_g1_i1.p1  ORF type:complete len:389 (-),score=57.16 TRINITY_DN70822_c0_g1_i1:1462-2628(-)